MCGCCPSCCRNDELSLKVRRLPIDRMAGLAYRFQIKCQTRLLLWPAGRSTTITAIINSGIFTMQRVVLLEHNLAEASRMARLLAEQGFEVEITKTPAEAIQACQKSPPDLVVTDMPEKRTDADDMSFIKWLHQHQRQVPIVLSLSRNEEICALQALETGAVSYIRKRLLEQDLPQTLKNTYGLLQRMTGQKRIRKALVRAHFQYQLENDPTLTPAVLAGVEDELKLTSLFELADITRMIIGLHEAIDNAIFHGNLEVSSALRDVGATKSYFELAESRRHLSPYRERHVDFEMQLSREGAEFLIQDEGPGFNPQALPDPTAAANLERPSGRGLLLIRSFFDEVEYSPTGNELRLKKKATRSGGEGK
ncbi:DNA-binding response regulator CreB [Planctopirus ephydatiae]|uniref:DNA-binding response regulator CreB n=1 Tax=Planctopirus ephydatiae TaxID=2528019 RepID=A0A518GIH3_9PLAN|nr:DNA-binding response regulator CreB [Planctopirus ephydatiae]